MLEKYNAYRELTSPIPKENWAWNLYGAGIENIGRDNKPELFSTKEPAEDQLLVRVDSVGMCFSDVKLIKQGSAHPKLYNRDLKTNPTRVGHEAALTIVKVGKNLAGQFHAGQRLAIQPDIYQNQKSTAYGYSIPGALIQFHLIGPEVLNADNGSYVISIDEKLGYAETALTEPWACVEAAYTQRRRLSLKKGGTLWIVGKQGDDSAYAFSSGLDMPGKIIISDVPDPLKELLYQQVPDQYIIVEHNRVSKEDFKVINQKYTQGNGFDDIVLLNQSSAELVSEAAKLIAFRGTLNLVGRNVLDGMPSIDAGRIHYHYTTYIGNPGPDIAASYGEAHNRCELVKNGTAVFVGAGGPMGQMHVQRAVELSNGPSQIVAVDVSAERLAVLETKFARLAKSLDKKLILFNSKEEKTSLRDFIFKITDGRFADDVVVSVPIASVMEEAATLLSPDGMLVFFAGVPTGTTIRIKMDDIYRHHMQLTGTSGSRLEDQKLVIQKTLDKELSPNRSVAAIGGLEAARDGIQAMMSGAFAGKIVIFPQLSGLPLIGLDELHGQFPSIAEKLGENNTWTVEAEKELIEKFWTRE